MGKAELRKIHVRSGSGSYISIYANNKTYNGIEINVEIPFDKHTSLKMYNPTNSNVINGRLYIEKLDLRGLDVTSFFAMQGSISDFWCSGNRVPAPYGLKNIILEDGMDLSSFFLGCDDLHIIDLTSWAYKDVVMSQMFYNTDFGATITLPNLLPRVGFNHGAVFQRYSSSGDYISQRLIDISGWNLEHAQGIYWQDCTYRTTYKCKQEVADYILANSYSQNPPTFEIVG